MDGSGQVCAHQRSCHLRLPLLLLRRWQRGILGCAAQQPGRSCSPTRASLWGAAPAWLLRCTSQDLITPSTPNEWGSSFCLAAALHIPRLDHPSTPIRDRHLPGSHRLHQAVRCCCWRQRRSMSWRREITYRSACGSRAHNRRRPSWLRTAPSLLRSRAQPHNGTPAVFHPCVFFLQRRPSPDSLQSALVFPPDPAM